MTGGRNLAAQSDPARNPHFRRQWTEPLPCVGFKTIGEVAAGIVAHLPFQRKVERVHRLGPRVLGEMLAELGAERSIMTIIDQKLDTYGKLHPEALEVTGGDRFWPAPLREVEP